MGPSASQPSRASDSSWAVALGFAHQSLGAGLLESLDQCGADAARVGHHQHPRTVQPDTGLRAVRGDRPQ